MKSKKIWFITGVSSGLGKALALRALERGDTVIGTTKSGKADFESGSGRLIVLPMDIEDRKQVLATVKKAHDFNWRIDVVVTNDGYGLLWPNQRATKEPDQDHLDANYFGAAYVMEAVVPYLSIQGSGYILNPSAISAAKVSDTGRRQDPFRKSLLDRLSLKFAKRVRDRGVKITLIEPEPQHNHSSETQTYPHSKRSRDVAAAGVDWQNVEEYRSIKDQGSTTERMSSVNYKSTVGAFLNRMSQVDDMVASASTKAAEQIMKLVDCNNPPMHSVLDSSFAKQTLSGASACGEDKINCARFN